LQLQLHRRQTLLHPPKANKMKTLKLLNTLMLATVFCAVLLLCRINYTGNERFMFLGFNLILAWIPMAVSSAMLPLQNKWWHHIIFWVLFIVWLGFFPNSPYIITDLLHLKHRADAPYWFDCMMISSFAWLGLMLGILSLYNVYEKMICLYNKSAAVITVVVTSLLCGYGIYLGRFLRWNTWDIVNNPDDLLNDVVLRFMHPFTYPRAHLMALVGAGVVITSFLIIAQLRSHTISVPQKMES
jgi:uncharacterized membrane protein